MINPTRILEDGRLYRSSKRWLIGITPPHWEVRIVDEVLEEVPADCIPDLVGLTSLITTVPRAYEIARHYRERGVPVVVGGVHATFLPDEVAQYVDVAFSSSEGWRIGGSAGLTPSKPQCTMTNDQFAERGLEGESWL